MKPYSIIQLFFCLFLFIGIKAFSYECTNVWVEDYYYNLYEPTQPGEYRHAVFASVRTEVPGTFYVPESVFCNYNPYKVTAIGPGALAEKNELSGVVIPEGIIEIGNGAFKKCKNLVSVSFPNSIEIIGNSVFADCMNLPSLTLPQSIKSIGYEAFKNCTSLTNINIPENVSIIEKYLFDGCGSLTSINIPSMVTEIGGGAFRECRSLASIIIPDNVTTIYGATFEECTSLTYLTIGKNVKTIGNHAFRNCTSLKEIYCYAVEPPKVSDYSFGNGNVNSILLIVPESSVEQYKSHRFWKNFWIESPTAITSPTDWTKEETYSLKGFRLTTQQKGLNIIRYFDGTTKKVIK